MKFYVLTITTVLLCLAPLTVAAQSRTGQPIPLAGQQSSPPLAVLAASQPATSTAAAATAPRGPILRILKRRRIGLTFRNVVRVLQEMKADGRLADYAYVDEDGRTVVDVSSLAVGVASQLADEKPGDWSDIDWDAILAFLERLIELILKFLPLFL